MLEQHRVAGAPRRTYSLGRTSRLRPGYTGCTSTSCIRSGYGPAWRRVCSLPSSKLVPRENRHRLALCLYATRKAARQHAGCRSSPKLVVARCPGHGTALGRPRSCAIISTRPLAVGRCAPTPPMDRRGVGCRGAKPPISGWTVSCPGVQPHVIIPFLSRPSSGRGSLLPARGVAED
jgi:hypothetical protein